MGSSGLTEAMRLGLAPAQRSGPREFLGPLACPAPSLPTLSFIPPWGPLTDESIGDGDLEPHAVSDLQPGFRGGHGFHNGSHVTVDGQVEII